MATVETGWQRPSIDAGRDTETQRLSKRAYEKELTRLQTELVRLQDWIVRKGLKGGGHTELGGIRAWSARRGQRVVFFSGARNPAERGGRKRGTPEKPTPRGVR